MGFEPRGVRDQSLIDDMRAALRGERERAARRVDVGSSAPEAQSRAEPETPKRRTFRDRLGGLGRRAART